MLVHNFSYEKTGKVITTIITFDTKNLVLSLNFLTHMEAIGDRIKAIRIKKGYAQDGVAQAAGISQAALSKIENGQVEPKIGTVARLAKSLDVEMAEVLGNMVANEVLGTRSLLGMLLFRLRCWWWRRKARRYE